jgi:hypothetical protein
MHKYLLDERMFDYFFQVELEEWYIYWKLTQTLKQLKGL